MVSVVAITARMPSTLFAAIADPMPAPSMTMPASASPRATASRHARRDVRIVHRIVSSVPRSFDRQAAAAQERDERLPQRDARVVAGDRHRPDVGATGAQGRLVGRQAVVPQRR